MLELAILGIITGAVSGFFGVGGGMVLIPMLLFANFEMKQAVSISIMQMVFSSVFGSFLNSKKNKEILRDGLFLGIGGFIGGSLSGIIVSNVSGDILQYLFLLIVILAIVRVSMTPAQHDNIQKDSSPKRLITIGFFIGMIAMSIGVGGSVMLTPILAGYLHYNLKHASSLGLFFVMFSSIAGFLSLSLAGHMMYFEGAIVGIASLFGVYLGIYVKNKTHITSYKKLILILYVMILVSVAYKL
ncbi:MAG: sulfite exporter TauE/SafE family protein [Arcobacteraceae bacterium]|nr:sulfite exporter TauE/SafE family protein [Arcobacteraceae bacterium]